MPQSWPEIDFMRLAAAFLCLASVGAGFGACWVPAALAEDAAIPLPRPRPPLWIEPHSFAEAIAGLDFDATAVTDRPTECDARLAGLAEAEPMPRLIGPATCGGADMVEVKAVLLSDDARVAVNPPALLNCGMAESLAAWLRDEAAPRAAKLGSPLVAIENYDSYECRPRNRILGAKLSEHAHGDAIDLRALHLADGRRLALTDVTVDKTLRQGLRDSACRRFTTVLGPGEPFHEGHIHLDVIQRSRGYRICQWDVREPPPPVEAANAPVPLPVPRPVMRDAPVKHSDKL